MLRLKFEHHRDSWEQREARKRGWRARTGQPLPGWLQVPGMGRLEEESHSQKVVAWMVSCHKRLCIVGVPLES
jgi:hypothetical protein